jgi:hypothetical protein
MAHEAMGPRYPSRSFRDAIAMQREDVPFAELLLKLAA